jgi:hypothetical protein
LENLGETLSRASSYTHPKESWANFRGRDKLYLFVDVKTSASSSYRILHKLLERYKDIVTQFKPNTTNDKPVVIVISGNGITLLDKIFEIIRNVVDGELHGRGVLQYAPTKDKTIRRFC